MKSIAIAILFTLSLMGSAFAGADRANDCGDNTSISEQIAVMEAEGPQGVVLEDQALAVFGEAVAPVTGPMPDEIKALVLPATDDAETGYLYAFGADGCSLTDGLPIQFPKWLVDTGVIAAAGLPGNTEVE